MAFQGREKNDYLDLGRNFYQNHYRAEASKTEVAIEEVAGTPADKATYKINEFLHNNILGWIKHYFKSRFGKKHPYQNYNGDDIGIYKVDNNNISIACAADWASDTIESDIIGRKIASHDPEYTIHLGDTYFVGAPFEIENNFLNPDASWPMGSKGSFALLGNHEMYSRGVAYFERLLPALGVKNGATSRYEGQKASYFCLENDYWRVIGLDTGYNSVGKIPIIEKIFTPDCELEEEHLNWLENKLQLRKDNRGLIFLSHHQYNSAFERNYEVPAKQLARIIGRNRPVIWIWGHEHRFSMYGKYNDKLGISAYGRCIGHGGMPIELLSDKPDQDKIREKNLVLFDNRFNQKIGKVRVGVNGYAIINFNNENVDVDYYDSKSKIVSEKWEIDNFNGKLSGRSIDAENGLEIVQELDKAIQ